MLEHGKKITTEEMLDWVEFPDQFRNMDETGVDVSLTSELKKEKRMKESIRALILLSPLYERLVEALDNFIHASWGFAKQDNPQEWSILMEAFSAIKAAKEGA